MTIAETTAMAHRHGALRERLSDLPVIEVQAGSRQLQLRTRHGLFSSKAIDEGTALLLHELEAVPAQARVLDLGCGYGAIGLTLAARWPTAQVALIDSDLRAVEATAENALANNLPNAAAVLSDGLRDAPPGPYDLVVSNLPAQAGNDALDLLLLDAHDALSDGGSLVVVTVNGLRRYLQRRLVYIFTGRVNKAHQGPRHTVLEAHKVVPA